MVTVRVPVVAREDALKVTVELPVPVMEVGLKVAVTPEGNPLAESDTAELNPFEMVLVIEDVPEPLLTIVTEVGLALRANVAPAGNVTVNVTVVVCVIAGLVQVPVTVMV